MSQVIGSTFSGIKQNGTQSTLWRITSAMCCEKKLKLNRKMTELFRSHFSSSGLPAPRCTGWRRWRPLTSPATSNQTRPTSPSGNHRRLENCGCSRASIVQDRQKHRQLLFIDKQTCNKVETSSGHFFSSGVLQKHLLHPKTCAKFNYD